MFTLIMLDCASKSSFRQYQKASFSLLSDVRNLFKFSFTKMSLISPVKYQSGPTVLTFKSTFQVVQDEPVIYNSMYLQYSLKDSYQSA